MDYTEKVDAIRHPGPVENVWRDYQMLVQYATLAASNHNSQPWLFKLHDQAIEILPDPDRRTRGRADPGQSA